MSFLQRLHPVWAAVRHAFVGKPSQRLSHPFLRELHSQVIAPALKPIPEFAPLENLREQWLQDQTTITITDYGAGSKHHQGPERKISNLARHSLTPARFSQLLALLIRHLGITQVAELGTSLGLNSLYLSKAIGTNGHLTTFEGCPNLAQRAKTLFAGNSQITVIPGNLDTTWPTFLQSTKPLQLIYFDANHRLAPTLHYFEACLSHLTEHAVLVFDDIHWSSEMEQAWRQIKQHPKVRLTLDVYEAGLVFLGPNLPTGHYHIAWPLRG